VTPTSQIVGIQTVNNVLFDDEKERYKMITAQVRDLCYGLYGKTAVPIDSEVQKKALKGYKRGEQPIICRPAEVLEPELEKAKEEIGDLAKDIDDVVTYALYPVTGKRFLKWKYGHEDVPPEVMPKTLAQVKKEQELIKKAKAGLLVEKKEKEVPEKSENVRTFNVFVDDEYFEIGVDEMGESPMINYIQQLGQMPVQPVQMMQPVQIPKPSVKAKPAATVVPPPPKPAAPATSAPPASPKPAESAAPAAPVTSTAEGTPVKAPCPA
jgi:pyruvate carboxylase subunit B